MPVALLDAAGWEQVHATAVSLQSLQAAAVAHGIDPATVRQRARRDGWLIGHPDQVAAARQARDHPKRSVVLPPVTVSRRSSAEVIDEQVVQNGRETRVMLAQALLHASGQARRTKHPLDRARQIKDVAAAAAQVHGWSGDAAASIIMPIQINITRE